MDSNPIYIHVYACRYPPLLTQPFHVGGWSWGEVLLDGWPRLPVLCPGCQGPGPPESWGKARAKCSYKPVQILLRSRLRTVRLQRSGNKWMWKFMQIQMNSLLLLTKEAKNSSFWKTLTFRFRVSSVIAYISGLDVIFLLSHGAKSAKIRSSEIRSPCVIQQWRRHVKLKYIDGQMALN